MGGMSLFIVRNDGQAIVETNYWSSEVARRGLIWCSVNAGAIRVLLPPEREEFLPDMGAASECILSRGPWPAMKLADAFELLWDDGSDSPFAFHLAPESFDSLPAEPMAGREWQLSVWTERERKPRMEREWTCHWRRSNQLPDLRPWTK
jgi:hypothetical protein